MLRLKNDTPELLDAVMQLPQATPKSSVKTRRAAFFQVNFESSTIRWCERGFSRPALWSSLRYDKVGRVSRPSCESILMLTLRSEP